MKSPGMMKNRLEKDVIKSVLIGLRIRQLQGEVVWFSRLNSGSIHGDGYHVKLCDPGTPDIIVAVRHNQGAKLLFLECKREGINKLETEQEVFFKRMEGVKGVYCKLINDEKQLTGIIYGILQRVD